MSTRDHVVILGRSLVTVQALPDFGDGEIEIVGCASSLDVSLMAFDIAERVTVYAPRGGDGTTWIVQKMVAETADACEEWRVTIRLRRA
jgi:hypothetical protein